jgi:hypothetical protein
VAEELKVQVGDRLRLTYPATSVFSSFDAEVCEVVVTYIYDDGAFNVDRYPVDAPSEDHVPSTEDWTVFPDEIKSGVLTVEKIS